MTPYNKILSLIEAVDPSDAAALDEIDARVWCFLHDARFKKMLSTPEHYKHGYFSYYQGSAWGSKMIYPPMQYTRSRDALKAIRPEKWIWSAYQQRMAQDEFVCTLLARHDNHWKDCNSPHLPTEELAELHAIISAIEHDRNTPPPTSTE